MNMLVLLSMSMTSRILPSSRSVLCPSCGVGLPAPDLHNLQGTAKHANIPQLSLSVQRHLLGDKLATGHMIKEFSADRERQAGVALAICILPSNPGLQFIKSGSPGLHYWQ